MNSLKIADKQMWWRNMGTYGLSVTGYIFNRKTGHLWYLATDIQELYDMYESGKFYIKEIARWLGIGRDTVKKFIKIKNDIQPLLKKLPKVDYEWQKDSSIV